MPYLDNWLGFSPVDYLELALVLCLAGIALAFLALSVVSELVAGYRGGKMPYALRVAIYLLVARFLFYYARR